MDKQSLNAANDRYVDTEGRQLWIVFGKVVGFIIAIMIVPVVGYFGTKWYLFEGKLGYNAPDSNFWAAGIAIALVHIALVAFLYVAFSEQPPKTEKSAKAEKAD